MSDKEKDEAMFRRLAEKAVEPPCPCCGGEFRQVLGRPIVISKHYMICGNCGRIPVEPNEWGRYLPVDMERIRPPFHAIESVADRMGGMPVLKDTRFLVSTILAELADPLNQRTAAQIAAEYGQDPAIVLEALHEIALMFQKPFWK